MRAAARLQGRAVPIGAGMPTADPRRLTDNGAGDGFPVWPLWYAALAWVHVRQAGGLLVLGLAIGALL